MSLFNDSDFDFGVALEGCAKKEADAPELADQEADAIAAEMDAELAEDPEVESQCEAAAEYDLNCTSISECVGFPGKDQISYISAMLTEQMLLDSVAFNKVDVACSEAYVRASDNYEKEAVTEAFKESAKKYWERFKGFCLRIKNLIVRAFTRFWGYLKKLASKASAKLTAAALDKRAKDRKDLLGEVEIDCYDALKDSAAAVIKKVKDAANTSLDKDVDINGDGKVTVADSSEIIKNVLGEKKTLKGDAFGTVDSIITSLKKCEAEMFKPMGDLKKEILKTIDTEQKNAYSKDSSPEDINAAVKLLNGYVKVLNRYLSVANTAASSWVFARVKIIAKLATKSKKDDDKKDKEKKDGAATESMSLFEQYLGY